MLGAPLGQEKEAVGRERERKRRSLFGRSPATSARSALTSEGGCWTRARAQERKFVRALARSHKRTRSRAKRAQLEHADRAPLAQEKEFVGAPSRSSRPPAVPARPLALCFSRSFRSLSTVLTGTLSTATPTRSAPLTTLLAPQLQGARTKRPSCTTPPRWPTSRWGGRKCSTGQPRTARATGSRRPWALGARGPSASPARASTSEA